MTTRKLRCALGIALIAISVASSTASARTVPKVAELAGLKTAHEAYKTPGGAPLQRVLAVRPLTGERTTLPVLSAMLRKRNGHAIAWVKVALPGRPNGLTGWIKAAGVKFEFTTWHLVVSTLAHRVSVYRAGRRVRSFSVITGAPATPTPKGKFFVEETVSVPANAVGTPFALALSARSDVLQEFAGGPGQIALHGIGNIGGVLGTSVSHGCIRLDTAGITWLAHRIDPGVPVTIA